MINALERVANLETHQIEGLLYSTRIAPSEVRDLGRTAFNAGNFELYDLVTQIAFYKGSDPQQGEPAVSYAEVFSELDSLRNDTEVLSRNQVQVHRNAFNYDTVIQMYQDMPEDYHDGKPDFDEGGSKGYVVWNLARDGEDKPYYIRVALGIAERLIPEKVRLVAVQVNRQQPLAKQTFHTDTNIGISAVLQLENHGMFEIKDFDGHVAATDVECGDVVIQRNGKNVLHRGRNTSDRFTRINIALFMQPVESLDK